MTPSHNLEDSIEEASERERKHIFLHVDEVIRVGEHEPHRQFRLRTVRRPFTGFTRFTGFTGSSRAHSGLTNVARFESARVIDFAIRYY